MLQQPQAHGVEVPATSGLARAIRHVAQSDGDHNTAPSADPVAGEGEDEQGPERRLTVGSRRHDHVASRGMASMSLR